MNFEAKAKRSEKRRAYAWARYYEQIQSQSEIAEGIVRYVEIAVPRNGAEFDRPAVLPNHITTEIMDMAEKLNKDFSCPCCFELMNKETIHITWCGHYVCKDCYEKLPKDERGKKKCPICRKNV